MGYEERIGWLLIGMVVGFVAGYIVRALRELREDVHDVKEELHEVDQIVKDKLSNEDGFTDNKLITGIMYIVVLAIVAYAAFASNNAANDAHKTTECNAAFLSKTIVALNERTEYSGRQAQANVKLQTAQQTFFELLLRKPPEDAARRSQAAAEYLAALNTFVDLAKKTKQKADTNPYPTYKQLQDCLS